MKSKKNAFTLIELLAIIVILAIIAVITVPIILNIIENSKKGAASDSAYGYKDAVNKWYVTELSKPNNQNFSLSSSYTVEDGKIIDDSVQNDTGILIPFSGDKPSSGELHYSNNVLQGGCLVFGDYAVTFETDGTISTVKGDCDEYVYSDGSIPSCPGCVFGKFIHYKNDNNQYVYEEIGALPKGTYTDSYSGLGDYFLGQILDDTTGEITRSFVCNKEGNEYYCLEGADASKNSYNVSILQGIYPSCPTLSVPAGTGVQCSNSSSVVKGNVAGAQVNVYDGNGHYCSVDKNGTSSCNG